MQKEEAYNQWYGWMSISYQQSILINMYPKYVYSPLGQDLDQFKPLNLDAR